MSESEQRTTTKRRDGEAAEEDYRMMWAAMSANKERLEHRLAELELEHMNLLNDMRVVAQEARANGVTLSRYAWVRRPITPQSLE
jgi:hypothetical protein